MIKIIDISKYFNNSIINNDAGIKAALPNLFSHISGGSTKETLYIISLTNIDFLLDNYFLDEVISKLLSFRDKDKEFVILSDMTDRNLYNIQQFVISKNKIAHENNKIYPIFIRSELLLFSNDEVSINYDKLSPEFITLAGDPTNLVLDTFLKTFKFPLGFTKQEFETIFSLTHDQARSRLSRSVGSKIIREKKLPWKNTGVFRNAIYFGS